MKKIVAIVICSSLATALMYCSSKQEAQYREEIKADTTKIHQEARELKQDMEEGVAETNQDIKEAADKTKAELKEIKVEVKQEWEDDKAKGK
ncbi:MAG: hypothetical protein H7282_04095 [Cytophagaceae bacterium]|nr:hypothetical protein [Cytophagaceae bacterium]